MKSVISVIGKDRTGIIAGVTSVLSENDVNILDISQTILDEYFTMIMITDMSKMKINFSELIDKLNEVGKKLGVSVKVQREELFNAMYKI